MAAVVTIIVLSKKFNHAAHVRRLNIELLEEKKRTQELRNEIDKLNKEKEVEKLQSELDKLKGTEKK